MDVPEKLNYIEFKHGKYAVSTGFIFWVLRGLPGPLWNGALQDYPRPL